MVLLSAELWERRFERDPHILGRRLHLGGALRTVIGVMPRTFSTTPTLFSARLPTYGCLCTPRIFARKGATIFFA